MDEIGYLYGLVFAGCCLALAGLVYFFLIESKDRALEEIDTMYLEHVLPWKSSKWEAPPPQEIAAIRKRAGTELVAEGAEIENPARADAESTHQEHV